MKTAFEELPLAELPEGGQPDRVGSAVAAKFTAIRLHGIAGLESLAEPWQLLTCHTAGPMESYDWAQAAAAALAAEQAPLCVAVARDDEFRGIGQLAQLKGSWLGRLEMLGVGRLNEPSDFVYADHSALAALCAAAVRLRRPLLLNRLPSDSPTINAFQSAARGKGITIVRPQASCPTILLDETWREPEAHLSSRRRSDFRRAERRAEKVGPVEYEISAPAPSEVDELLERAFAIEARSWKGEAGTALAVDPVRGAFIRGFASSAAEAGTLRLCFLRIGDDYAAMQIAVQQADALWLLKIGFDPEHGNCSPGQLLLAESIRYAVGQGLKSFEFLGTAEDWTRVWTQHERQTVSLRFYPLGVRGMTALAADTLASARRKLIGRTAVRVKQPVLQTATRSNVGQRIRRLAKAPLYGVARVASRSYIAGDNLNDALRVAVRLRERGLSTTLGYWDATGEPAEKVLAAYAATIDAIAAAPPDCYASIKLPSLQYSGDALVQLGERARRWGIRLHFDAMAPDSVDRTWQTITDSLPAGSDLGCTLPARWQRSVADADWAVEHGMAVRIVKGQWADPARDVEPIAGFLAIVERLAGRARAVAVATHNAALAEQALRRLQAAGTPVTLELLYGLPSRRQIEIARRLNVPVRIYVPYGSAYLPYCLGELKKNPRIAWWLMRDALRRS
jgi:CelD/BcsL family acetyltransferase involved in cellulose biosynthesis